MLAGFAGILTPCVFPMIPMTVAFFSQGTGNKGSAIGKALIFGLSIILLYSSLGIIVSLTSAGAGFANTLRLTDTNLLSAAVPGICRFVLRAFEIFFLQNGLVSDQGHKGGLWQPSPWSNNSAVSLSCTGPIVGAHLWRQRQAMCLSHHGCSDSASFCPSPLFALFPSWLQKRPKSGGWLNSVKLFLVSNAGIQLKFAQR